MEKKGNKTYYFTATLNPAEYCRDFNPGELYLGNGYRLDIFFNGITIWNPNLKSTFVKVRPIVWEAFDTLIAAFIFREHIVSNRIFKLSINIQRCIEAMNVKADANLIWTLDYPGKIYTPSPKSRVNVTWRRVAKFFPKINKSVNHKIALKDYLACINEPGDNAFFFAYRIIEDIKRAIDSENNIVDEQDWSGLHNALNVDKKFMDPLIKIANEVRHGDLNSHLVVNARKKNRRKKILGIAFDLMKREFKRKFPRFLY